MPKKLTELDTSEVSDLDDEEFRLRLLYDLQNMRFWFWMASGLNTLLLGTMLTLIGMILRYGVFA